MWFWLILPPGHGQKIVHRLWNFDRVYHLIEIDENKEQINGWIQKDFIDSIAFFAELSLKKPHTSIVCGLPGGALGLLSQSPLPLPEFVSRPPQALIAIQFHHGQLNFLVRMVSKQAFEMMDYNNVNIFGQNFLPL